MPYTITPGEGFGLDVEDTDYLKDHFQAPDRWVLNFGPQHPAAHGGGRVRRRRAVEAAGHHPGQQQHVVADVKHAAPLTHEVHGRLARGKRLEHQPREPAGGPLAVVDPGPHRGNVEPAVGCGRGHKSFEDHRRP
jgi:hypothetical protein